MNPFGAFCTLPSRLYGLVENRPQRVDDGKRDGPSPERRFSGFVAESFHATPGPDRSTCKEQEQEKVFGYASPVASPPSSLTIESTAVGVLGITEPPCEEFVESVHTSNKTVPSEEGFPKEDASYHSVRCLLARGERGRSWYDRNNILPTNE